MRENGEVRIERDRAVHVFLDLPNTSVPELSELAIGPVVIFSDWAVKAAEWVC